MGGKKCEEEKVSGSGDCDGDDDDEREEQGDFSKVEGGGAFTITET